MSELQRTRRRFRFWQRRPALVAALVLAIPPALLTLLATVADPSRATAEITADYAGGGVQLCLACHGPDSDHPGHDILDTPHGYAAHSASPFTTSANQCEACHGPSADHLRRLDDGSRPPPAVSFIREERAEHRDAMCTGCHAAEAGMHWPASEHRFHDVACTDCHRVHQSPDPVIARATQAETCYTCHQRERAELLRRSAHPVHAGSMTCTDCHAPHGGIGPAALLRASVNETCYDCHAALRGPFLWEHAPVREDCTHCHVPHGSAHADLLVARTPWLCQQCHLAQFHPSTLASGAGIPPRGASGSILGQNCMNCHSQVHGSNHPSGPGLTR